MVFYYVCFDPGTTHLAAAILSEDEEKKIVLEWFFTFDVSPVDKHEHTPSISRARQMCNRVMSRLHSLMHPGLFIASSCKVYVEQQPCIRRGGPNTIRNNCWTEGFILGYFQAANVPVHDTLSPNGVKAHFKIRSGDYATNKALALRKAEELLGIKLESDHVADCVLLAFYAQQKNLL
jgi:hypothetical protein